MAHYRYSYIIAPGWTGVSGTSFDAEYSRGTFKSRRIAKAAFKGHPIYSYDRGYKSGARGAIDHLFPWWSDTPGKNHPTKAVRRG